MRPDELLFDQSLFDEGPLTRTDAPIGISNFDAATFDSVTLDQSDMAVDLVCDAVGAGSGTCLAWIETNLTAAVQGLGQGVAVAGLWRNASGADDGIGELAAYGIRLRNVVEADDGLGEVVGLAARVRSLVAAGGGQGEIGGGVSINTQFYAMAVGTGSGTMNLKKLALPPLPVLLVRVSAGSRIAF